MAVPTAAASGARREARFRVPVTMIDSMLMVCGGLSGSLLRISKPPADVSEAASMMLFRFCLPVFFVASDKSEDSEPSQHSIHK